MRGLAALALVLALALAAGAQDRERGPTPEADRAPVRPAAPPAPAPPRRDRYDTRDEAPEPGTEPSAAEPHSEPAATAPPTPTGFFEQIELKLDARVRLELGHDTNVFRSADRYKRGDGLFRGLGEVELVARMPEGGELFASLSGEGTVYFFRHKAEEMFATSFIEYFHPLTSWLDVGAQNTLEYSRQNLLDDNGDLLPRETFNALDEEPRAFAIFHAAEAVSFELGSGWRSKNFEEEPPQPSLDFQELRADATLRIRVPWWPDGKARVKYRWRERIYKELQALARSGAVTADAPHLVLERHQASVSISQKLRPFDTELTVTLGYSFTLNQDTFENDRSYREHGGSLRAEWWIWKDWTRIEADVRGGGRNFLVRRSTTDPRRLGLVPAAPGSFVIGHGLRQRFLETSALVWQKVVDHLAIVAQVSWFDWGSTEPLESYGRFVVQAGIEGSF